MDSSNSGRVAKKLVEWILMKKCDPEESNDISRNCKGIFTGP